MQKRYLRLGLIFLGDFKITQVLKDGKGKSDMGGLDCFC